MFADSACRRSFARSVASQAAGRIGLSFGSSGLGRVSSQYLPGATLLKLKAPSLSTRASTKRNASSFASGSAGARCARKRAGSLASPPATTFPFNPAAPAPSVINAPASRSPDFSLTPLRARSLAEMGAALNLISFTYQSAVGSSGSSRYRPAFSPRIENVPFSATSPAGVGQYGAGGASLFSPGSSRRARTTTSFNRESRAASHFGAAPAFSGATLPASAASGANARSTPPTSRPFAATRRGEEANALSS